MTDMDLGTPLGYTLSSEELGPLEHLSIARLAEEAGIGFVLISDHFHPWVDRQGQSPFVWSSIGGVAAVTERLRIGTGVTCPTMRIHPAIVAQAAATSAAMLPGRFFLGIGTGENLNEHILGDGWPPADVRRAMTREAVEVIRELWTGEDVIHRGDHYTVENARIYTLPEELPPVYVAAGGPQAAELAGEIGEGFIGTAPKKELTETYGGKGPRIGQLNVCWGPDEAAAKKTAHEWWPNVALPGELSQELATPAHFGQAAEMVSEDDVAEAMPVGPDLDRIAESIQEYLDAGYTHVYLHQVGPEQESFIEVLAKELMPRFG